jgi:hypothetical protein
MDTKDSGSTRCVSCDGNALPKSLQPYCSVVCRALGLAGLAWRTKPYRVVDLHSGDPVNLGPSFDLTMKGMTELQKQSDRVQEKARTNLAAPWVPEALSLVWEQVAKTPAGVTDARINLNV